MKKSKLIRLLNEIEGDPDILLWNGVVGDWQNIQLVPSNLYREKLASVIESTETRYKLDRKDWDYQLTEQERAEVKKFYPKDYPWHSADFITEATEHRYSKKAVVFIDAIPRGVTTWDRLGTIEY